MNQLFLNDSEVKENLYPFSLIRSVSDIRIGILTIREKWEKLLNKEVVLISDEYPATGDAIIFAANIIPSRRFTSSLVKEDGTFSESPEWDSIKIIQYPWHIFLWNDWALREDFELITENNISEPIPENVQTVNNENIFIEADARLSNCILNASTGPIYIGKNAEVMEGSVIRGPFALCEGSVVKMGSRIYGATTVGPYSVVGGEVKNSVILGYSNKAHDGYLGDAVIGEWCNIGAGTSNSNIKNNASEIKVWNYSSREYITAGMKCGLLMGDYSRSAINIAFNTGTVVGVCCNVFGEGLPSKFIPSFTWGNQGLSRYEFEKAMIDIANWKRLKNQQLTEAEINTLKIIYNQA